MVSLALDVECVGCFGCVDIFEFVQFVGCSRSVRRPRVDIGSLNPARGGPAGSPAAQNAHDPGLLSHAKRPWPGEGRGLALARDPL